MKSNNTSLLVSILIYLSLASYFWFICDDAFISFRYSDNLVNGFGLVYNSTESPPVEGYSNFLWVLIAAAYLWAGLDITTFIPLTSIITGVFGLLLLAKTLDHFKVKNFIQLIILLSAAIFPPYFIYGTSGLETLPAAVCLFACYTYLLLFKRLVPATTCAIALSLLRPEGIVWVLIISIFSLFNKNYRLSIRFLLIVLPVFSCYFFWRWQYFQEMLPLTVVNKVGLTELTFQRGLNYSLNYFFTYLIPLLLGLLTLLSLPKFFKDLTLLSLLTFTFGLYLYPLTTGGDFMTSGRFFVSSVLFQFLLIAILLNKLNLKSLNISTLMVGIIAALTAFNIFVIPKTFLANFHFRLNSPDYRTEAEQHFYMNYNSERWKVLGTTLNRLTKPGDSIVAGAIGNLGFYSKRHIYDRFGLVEKSVANLPDTYRKAKSPGHDKSVDADYFLKYQPTILKAYIMPTANQPRIAAQLSSWKSKYADKYLGEHHPLDYIDSKGRKLSVLVLRKNS